jgi:phenylacetate-coenzyme A ligase PaaK-like adenylate-forming protein
MPIIGKLLKKTSEFGARRIASKGLHFKDQLKVLRKLLETSQDTHIGKHYHFGDIAASKEMVEAFQKAVPIRDYDQFYQTWLHRCLDGEKDVIWPGKIKYFALSSGTTGSPSKRIPVTKNMIRSFQKNTIMQFTATGNLNLSEGFYQKSFLAVGGSSKPERIGKHYEGDLSGILKKHTSIVLLPFTKPDSETASIKDWNQKLDRMVEKAPEWDISTIAGIPSWCIMLMERIIERYQVKSIHDIWPNLELYMFGGVYIEPYLKRFEKVCGKKVHILNTYLASEGYFGYQNRPDTNGMQLLLKSGIFFEFVPFNRDNFDEYGNLKPEATALTIEEVRANEDYAMVISTNAGLWRYLVGDLVQFVDIERKEVRISGRIRQYLSLVGEHLSLDNINMAIKLAGEKLDVAIPEFCLFADTENQRHNWYFGTDKHIDSNLVMETVDKILCDLNDDYKSVRKYDTLKTPVATQIPTEKYYQFMEEKGKLGSQNKFPRVMNAHQSKEWVLFLSN